MRQLHSSRQLNNLMSIGITMQFCNSSLLVVIVDSEDVSPVKRLHIVHISDEEKVRREWR